jgi:hypothetical protein
MLDQHLRFPRRVEDLAVQQPVPELAIERLAMAVLPWAAGRDVDRLRSDAAEPLAQLFASISDPLSLQMNSGAPRSTMRSAKMSMPSFARIRRAG